MSRYTEELSLQEIKEIQKWIQPLVGPGGHWDYRNIYNGVVAAQLLRIYFPALVDLIDYRNDYKASSNMTKNWITLDKKVLRKIGYKLESREMHDLAYGKEGSFNLFLFNLRPFILHARTDRKSTGARYTRANKIWKATRSAGRSVLKRFGEMGILHHGQINSRKLCEDDNDVSGYYWEKPRRQYAPADILEYQRISRDMAARQKGHEIDGMYD